MKLQIPQIFSFDRFLIALIVLGSLSLTVFFTISNSAHAQELIGFYTNLTGIEEVPPINTTASGLAVLLYNNESSQLSYLVNVTGLEKISQSGIHNGTRGINGDVVIPLKGNETAGKKDIASILFQDEMKVNDLQGPLKGKKITDLVKLMSNESAYVNILTERNPSGEIRGQLIMGQIQLDPTGSITGLMVPGGVVKLAGVALKNGVIVIESTGNIGFVPALGGGSSPVNTGGVVDGVTGVVGELGDVVGKVGGTVQKTGESVEQSSSAVVETVDGTSNTLENTVEKILTDDDDDHSGDSKDSDDDEKDSDDDEKDSDDDEKDSDDDEKDDDGGDSVKDTVEKLLD